LYCTTRLGKYLTTFNCMSFIQIRGSTKWVRHNDSGKEG
jgi:hypothetical protein